MGIFRFKYFALDDSRCAMKIGTDAVLLGAWVPLPTEGGVLDIGCGCGVLSLMAAQRNPLLKVTGVEIDPRAALQAAQNASLSPFHSRITIVNQDIRQFAENRHHTFDLIVSNPPFFQQSLKSRHHSRSLARHDISLSHDELLHSADLMLKDTGFLGVILPQEVFSMFEQRSAIYHLFATETVQIRHTPAASVSRIMGVFSRNGNTSSVTRNLALHNEDGSRSGDYLELTRDFYLFA